MGVPLTLDHLSSNDEIGVLEMGMSEPGQITILGEIIHPNMGVVTNVGVSHIEMMGSATISAAKNWTSEWSPGRRIPFAKRG